MNRYNTFWRRFFSGLIDGIIFVPIGLLDYLIIDSENVSILILGVAFSYSSFYVYTIYFHWSSGQTLGKNWMDVRVVDKSETRLLTFRQSIMRDSIYIILELIGLIILISRILELGRYPLGESAIENYLDWLATLWFLLEIATMLTNKRRRAIHDFLAGSVVIREEFWKKV
ncbi:RDD family protein [Chryseosolibacter indicus]|uniref:RDD family protein n=1 Tax=Chryseosolibacter indicus TaxID=2782351 RepID=A0ABS5VPN8_9BACT|nr:RDD family protein [Chryseosolibacter indicus]MBT1703407.1 RDD family protein [Chryseosolibacter indicus]